MKNRNNKLELKIFLIYYTLLIISLFFNEKYQHKYCLFYQFNADIFDVLVVKEVIK